MLKHWCKKKMEDVSFLQSEHFLVVLFLQSMKKIVHHGDPDVSYPWMLRTQTISTQN